MFLLFKSMSLIYLHHRCSLCPVFNLNVGRSSMRDGFSLVGSLAEVRVRPVTKQSTQLKHFAECSLWKYCTFCNVCVFVNHCDLEWLYFPCPSVAAIIYIFIFYCTEKRGQLFKVPHVLSGSTFWCEGGYIFLLFTFLLHDCVKCFSSKNVTTVVKESLTPHTRKWVLLFMSISHCNGLIHPLCLFAWNYFLFPSFSVCIHTKFELFVLDYPGSECFIEGLLSFDLPVSSQHWYIPHNPWQSRRWPQWHLCYSQAL